MKEAEKGKKLCYKPSYSSPAFLITGLHSPLTNIARTSPPAMILTCQELNKPTVRWFRCNTKP